VKEELIKPSLDGLSIGTVVGTFLGWLPHIAAILSIVWMAIRIMETHTVRRLMGKEPLK
jgi:hypothetical protein